jgi:TonB-dependent receptor
MHPTAGIRSSHAPSHVRAALMGSGMMAAMMLCAPAALAQQLAANGVEEVTVTGYAASLEKATDAKRNSTNFTDSVFAEDIGKFPDTNIAESLNRIPGVTISREIDGEGLNIQIRGLGTNFTKVTLNGANVAVASTGAADASNANREVDLNMFPTELFTQLSVSKSPTADLLEGGAAGNVNLRSARPFDREGFRINYDLGGSQYSQSPSMGYRGSMIVSDTWQDFGLLLGVSGVSNKVFTSGWEDGNAGWGSPGPLTGPGSTATIPAGAGAQCAATTCDTLGANFWSIPNFVPNNVTTGGLVPGQAIDQALLLSKNPGLTIQQVSNMLLPRLGRSMYERGHRDRYNGVISAEWRPTDSLHFYLDMVGGRTFNDEDRSDLDWGVRGGGGATPLIPLNVKLDPGSQAYTNNLGGVVTSGTFANSQFFLEARPYHEKGDFFSINPGGSWQINDLMKVDFQVNATRSHFFRDSPTYLFVTCPSAGNAVGVPGCTPPAGGVYANFSNAPGSSFPQITTNLDLNNPANFQWANGRVNLQNGRRYTQTTGAHADFTWGGDRIALHAGAAYDDAFRAITGIDASQQFQNAICGGNPSAFLPAGNSQPACDGRSTVTTTNTTGATAAALNAGTPGTTTYPLYPGYGTGYSAGFPPLTYGGSLVPQSALASYIVPGPTGFVSANYAALAAASHYYAIDAAANSIPNAHAGVTETYPFSAAATPGGNSGTIEEKNYGFYLQATGSEPIGGHNLRYNLGLRFVETHQYGTSPVTVVDPRNATLTDGALYPNKFVFATQKKTYSSYLPSLNLVYEVSDNFQVRGAISRTMTRADPNSLVSGVNFSDLTAQSLTLGNSALKPFYSNNLDLGFELYTGGAGYFGATAFRKGIAGFTINQGITQPFSYLAQYGITYSSLSTNQVTALQGRGCTSDTNCPATILVTQPINAPGLVTINGLEFDYVQPFDFLLDPWGLHGFGFNGNLTIIDQKSSGSAPAVAVGVAPMSYNVTGYYDNDGISVRLSYVWNDTSYASGTNTQSLCLPNTSAAPTCPGGAYLFTKAYGQADFSSSFRLAKLFGDIPTDPEVTFNVQNLFRSKLRSYDQFTTATHSYYNQGQVIMFGLRGSW